MSEMENKSEPPKPRTSSLAFAAMLFSIPSVFCGALLFLDPDLQGFVCPGSVMMIFAVTSALGGLSAIKESEGRLQGRVYAIVAIIMVAVVYGLIGLAIISHEIYHITSRPGPRALCPGRLLSLANELHSYTELNDGKYPTSEDWCDLLVQQNNTHPGSFVCSEHNSLTGQSCYALNRNVMGRIIADFSHNSVVILFKTEPGWNKVGGPEIASMNHHDEQGCCVIFNCGRVEFVKPEDIGKLKWTVEEAYDE